MKKCVIYARVSTTDQDSDNQVSILKEYAKKMEWEIVDTVVDVCSGGKGLAERPGLDKVFTMARKRKIDVVLFWALDRFSREGSRTTIQYLGMLDDAKVAWHSYSEPTFLHLGFSAMPSLRSFRLWQNKSGFGSAKEQKLGWQERFGSMGLS